MKVRWSKLIYPLGDIGLVTESIAGYVSAHCMCPTVILFWHFYFLFYIKLMLCYMSLWLLHASRIWVLKVFRNQIYPFAAAPQTLRFRDWQITKVFGVPVSFYDSCSVYLRIYLFVHLHILSVAHTMQHCKQWLVSNELESMWKKAIVAWFKALPPFL